MLRCIKCLAPARSTDAGKVTLSRGALLRGRGGRGGRGGGGGGREQEEVGGGASGKPPQITTAGASPLFNNSVGSVNFVLVRPFPLFPPPPQQSDGEALSPDAVGNGGNGGSIASDRRGGSRSRHPAAALASGSA